MSITGYTAAVVGDLDPNNQFVWVKWVDAQTAMDVAVAAARHDALNPQPGIVGPVQAVYAEGREQGQRDERERIREEVRTFLVRYPHPLSNLMIMGMIDGEDG
jgi:hypothetical protein